MIKPKFEQPKLTTHGTVESMTLRTGPRDDIDFFFFNGSTEGVNEGEGSQHFVCDTPESKCRKRG